MTLLTTWSMLQSVSGSTASRRSKITEIAALLRRLQPEEIEIGVAFLAGETRSGRTGIGYSLIESARVAAAPDPGLELRTVNRTLDQIASTAGRGSIAERHDC